MFGADDASLLSDLTQIERAGHTNFWSANAGVVLDETNNRFSPTYAPIMERLLKGACTTEDLAAINSRVLNTPILRPDGTRDTLGMKDCWMAQTITFRNKVMSANCRLCDPRLNCIRLVHFFVSLNVRLLHLRLQWR